MIQFRKSVLAAGLIAAGLLVVGPTQAALVEVIKIGTWGGLGAGTQDAGLQVGGKYVVKAAYDPVLTPVDPVTLQIDLATAAAAIGADSFLLQVPMEGLDTATPYVYTQTQADHFTGIIPTPQINFSSTSGAASDIVGFDFDGDFAAGAALNTVSLFNTSPVLQNTFGFNFDIDPAGTVTATSVNTLVDAVDPVAEAGPNRTYSATTLSVTTDGGTLADNGLGASRLDGEDFLTFDWTEGGSPLVGTLAPGTRLVDGAPADDVNITVALQNAGIGTTVDTAVWQVEVNEDLTGLGGSTDVMQVDYQNTGPVITTAQQTPVVDDILFELAFGDDDLAVGALIGILNFELLSVEILVDALSQTLFFDPLITTGTQLVTNAQLLSQFGLGPHLFEVTVTDRAGAVAQAAFGFEVLPGQGPAPVPEPATVALFGTGLVGLGALRRRRRITRG